MGDDDWQLDQLLDIFKRAFEARIRAGGSTVNKEQPSPPKPKRREDGTTHALLTGGDANCPTCTFCTGKHPSRDCQTVPDVLARKELLKKYGRCLVCLRKDDITRNCSAKFKCHKCKGRQHVSIFPANQSPLQPTNSETPVPPYRTTTEMLNGSVGEQWCRFPYCLSHGVQSSTTRG